jgi:3-keto-5-aminohexanoate cleavage enzyme
MDALEPLVVTATANISWLHPEVDYPKDPTARARAASACASAGAAVFHMHAEDSWSESIAAVRSASDLIVQCGMSSLPIPDRMEVFHSGADMISVIASHHDEAFAEVETNVLHGRDELESYAHLCRDYQVKPEFEIWHSGSVWNLRYLIDKGLVDPPYVTTLFFGWPGGTWSPPTVEEYLHRRRLLPEDCVVTVSIMGEGQLAVLAAAIGKGDHVRVGTEDNPFARDGSEASTEKLVEEVCELAGAMGRRIASPDEARGLLGTRPRERSTR